MKKIVHTIMLVFSAGCAGGFTNGIVVWFFGLSGISQALGVHIAPALTPAWLYPRLAWGGIWGLLFVLPILSGRPLARGLLFSLGPTLVQLFIIFPLKAHQGLMGLELGAMTPLLVIFFNFIWGLTAAYLLQVTENLK